MAVDDIKSANPILASILPERDRALGRLTSNELFKVLNPLPATDAAAQNFTPAQQAALLVNDVLQDLNFVPSAPVDPLLINETSPNLITVLENQDLSPSQRADLAFNDTLQTVSTPSGAPQNTTSTAAVAQNLTPGPLEVTPNTVLAAGVATGVSTLGVNLTAAVVTPTQITTPVIDTTVVNEEVTAIQPGAVQPIQDRNPIAVSVYEIRDQRPAPPEPKSKRKEVLPPMPIGRVRPVDRLALKQEWEKRKDNFRREELRPGPPLEERAIREMISRANEDLIANGVPLHLVLARDNEGYCLNIYDCSDEKVCRLSQEVHLDLHELLTILDNIQHETGIIININR
jgi:hypothetical protein